jgi:hypothetical protein
MSGSGRMNMRLASSYREDDHSRAVDHPCRQTMTAAGADFPGASPRPARSAVGVVRVVRAAIRRLVPRIA